MVTQTSGLPYNNNDADALEFCEEVGGFVQREPLSMFDPQQRRLAADSGLEKRQHMSSDEKINGLKRF